MNQVLKKSKVLKASSILLICIITFSLLTCNQKKVFRLSTGVLTLAENDTLYRFNNFRKRCFSREELDFLTTYSTDFGIDESKLARKRLKIYPIITDTIDCIGLYAFSFSRGSMKIRYKFLKFEDKLIVNKKNNNSNHAIKKAIREADKKYNQIFSGAQLDSLKNNFLRGNEIYGRGYW